jgi:hypothetical protein
MESRDVAGHVWPRYFVRYADACRRPSHLPQNADIQALPRMEDVAYQHVLPLYFADITVTTAFEPADAPQWHNQGSKHTMADMSRCCFNADR